MTIYAICQPVTLRGGGPDCGAGGGEASDGVGGNMGAENMQQGRAYERVISYIKDGILKGELKQGEKLPPERELAEQLGVGRNSVREALRMLGLMGFISSTQGAGNFVSCNVEKNLSESTQMMLLLGATD